MKTDLHTHTVFCDGDDSPERMVLSAIAKGLDVVGILAHSYVEFDKDGTLSPQKTEQFLTTVNALKEKYKDKITVLCGLEQDSFSKKTDGFDYIIGSVHYIRAGKEFAVDISEDGFVALTKNYFDGDYYALCERYFDEVSEVLEKTNADIIGHFDLVTKYNKNGKYFDTQNNRYTAAYKRAVDKLVGYNKPFEVNTGGIFAGRKTEPYPSTEIVEYIKSKGGRLILSSDAHSAEGVAFEFDKWQSVL